jgi:hypothetical protein
VPGGGSLLRQKPVEGLARPPDDGDRLLHLSRVPCSGNLTGSRVQLLHLRPQLHVLHAGPGVGGQLAEAALVGLSSPGLGYLENPAPVDGLSFDQALVFEQLEKRVDRAGTGSPAAEAALFQPVHKLVPVSRTFQ